MSNSSLVESDVFREVYGKAELYSAGTKPGVGDLPRYTGDTLFVEDVGSRMVDGNVETSSSGEDSFSGEEGERDLKGPEDGGPVLATLETANVKYLSSPVGTVYRPGHNVNVIEFKENIQAQDYSVNNPAYQHSETGHDDGAGLMTPYDHQQFYR